MEEWGLDPHRLTWANVLDAVRAGAVAHNHARVEALLRDGARVTGVRYRAPDGRRGEATARLGGHAPGPPGAEGARPARARAHPRPGQGVPPVADPRAPA